MPNGEIDAPRKIERMSCGFACIEHDQTNIRPRGAPPAGIPVPAHYFWQNFAGLHRLSEEFESSSFVGMASQMESGWHIFSNLHHHLGPL
jgi:hypothetical protein